MRPKPEGREEATGVPCCSQLNGSRLFDIFAEESYIYLEKPLAEAGRELGSQVLAANVRPTLHQYWQKTGGQVLTANVLPTLPSLGRNSADVVPVLAKDWRPRLDYQ